MRGQGKVFLLDDDELIVSMLARALKNEGYEVQAETDPRGVLDKLRAFGPDAVLLDIKLPGASGLDLLQEILGKGIARQVVMLTSDDSADTAVRAMKLGAADYLTKPFNLGEVKIVVKNVVEKGALKQEVDYLRRISSDADRHQLLGESPAALRVRKQAERLAEARVPTILLTGESGTGKEIFARYTHGLMYSDNARGSAPFIGINCAALPETLIESELFGHEKGAFTDAKAEKKGVFEIASGGSILLDEITEMKPFLQTKLLRVLEERQIRRIGGRHDIAVDATVFATSNRDLGEAVEKESFRADLYYRLSSFSIHIPALRERPDDIPLLARHFLQFFARRYNRTKLEGFATETEALMAAYHWPGNVRELKNVVERITVLGDGGMVSPEHLPAEITGQSARRARGGSRTIELPDSGLSLKEVEKNLIVQALEKSRGNKTQAAKLLNISYDTLRYQIKKYGLE